MKLTIKTALIFCLFFLLGGMTININAQRTEDPKEAKRRLKEEKKREKEELKQYKKMKPEQIKALKTGFDRLSTDLNQCAATKDSLNRRIADMEGKAMMQDSALKQMEMELASAKEKAAKASEISEAMAVNKENAPLNKGLVFAVQLGAYRNFSLTTPKKGISTDSNDGMNKYLLGAFANLRLAEAFKKEVQVMGIKDAWIVAFHNGKRITLEQAKTMSGK